MTLSNDVLAKRFAKGIRNGASAHASIVGDLFYSYSTRIAKRIENTEYHKIALLSDIKISMTTSRHIHALEWAFRDNEWTVLYTAGAREDTLIAQIGQNMREKDCAIRKSYNTRTEHMNRFWRERIEFYEEQNRLIQAYLDSIGRDWRCVYGNTSCGI